MLSHSLSKLLCLSFLALPFSFASSVALAQNGSAYCFGDGTGTPCPCAANGQSGEGCANSTGTGGAILTGAGIATLSLDNFSLHVSQVPGNEPGLLLQGSNQLNGGLGNPVSDGLLCTGGVGMRSQIQVTSGGATTFTNFNGVSFGASSYGLGVPTNYVFWYKDSANTCTGSGFNFTNAWTVTWTPGSPTAVPLVQIPAGSFMMGSDAASGVPYFGDPDTLPIRSITISEGFWMSATEITQSQYEAVTGVNPSLFAGVNHPVESVSWHDARAYCSALTVRSRASGNIPSEYEYRLPTEAEWEYACRAGTTAEYSIGPVLLCGEARFRLSYHTGTTCGTPSSTSVGHFAPNAWGLYDMHGNIAEWCLDSYASYSHGSATDPFVTGSGSARVVRGGGWKSHSPACRSASRRVGSPNSQHYNRGFRVVLAKILVP